MKDWLTVADRQQVQLVVDDNNKVVDRVDFAAVQMMMAHINLPAFVVVI